MQGDRFWINVGSEGARTGGSLPSRASAQRSGKGASSDMLKASMRVGGRGHRRLRLVRVVKRRRPWEPASMCQSGPADRRPCMRTHKHLTTETGSGYSPNRTNMEKMFVKTNSYKCKSFAGRSTAAYEPSGWGRNRFSNGRRAQPVVGTIAQEMSARISTAGSGDERDQSSEDVLSWRG